MERILSHLILKAFPAASSKENDDHLTSRL